MEIISEIQPSHGFKLQGRHPTGGQGFKPAQIYELLAQQEKANDPILILRQHFVKHSIWLWQLGAIEPHLCLKTKKTGEWYKFKQNLNDKKIEKVIEDLPHIKDFTNWCTQWS